MDQYTNKKTYICTRSRLARLLIDNNQEYKAIPNPWEPQRQAWLFTVTPNLLNIVADFYGNEGKPVPTYVQSLADQMGVML